MASALTRRTKLLPPSSQPPPPSRPTPVPLQSSEPLHPPVDPEAAEGDDSTRGAPPAPQPHASRERRPRWYQRRSIFRSSRTRSEGARARSVRDPRRGGEVQQQLPPAVLPIGRPPADRTNAGERDCVALQNDITATRRTTLWDQAVEALRKAESEHLSFLEQNLNEIPDQDSLAHKIGKVIDEREDKIRAGDGVSQKSLHISLRRMAAFMISTKDLGMGIARLDPSKVAPVVLGAVYCLVQCIGIATQESVIAVDLTGDVAQLVAFWTEFEEQQIDKNMNTELDPLYHELRQKIIAMYKCVISLLGRILMYFDGKPRKILAVLVQEHSEWEALKTKVKSFESQCNTVKSRISMKKDDQERTAKVLKWMSSHDFREGYKVVQERTQTQSEGLYGASCQWAVDSNEFRSWSTQSGSSVLCLHGTIGTGKTTVMARAVDGIQRSRMVEIEAKSLALFFFKKAGSLSVETCLRSLARQLSWNRATASIAEAAEACYQEFESAHVIDSSFTAEDCRKLLRNLLQDRVAYVMIDGIDECDEPKRLLDSLKDLWDGLKEVQAQHGSLHLLLCGRSDLGTQEYFDDCLTLETKPADTIKDVEFFVDNAIDQNAKRRSGALFFKSDRAFPNRLKAILKRKTQGIFRWAEIKIEYFTRARRLTSETQIEHELDQLEKITRVPELDEEYARLLASLASDLPRAKKMLRFIACAYWPLSAAALAEAVTASETQAGVKHLGITADDVRQFLLGFVHEAAVTAKNGDRERKYSPGERYNKGLNEHVIEFAHSSVLEYLSIEKATSDDFTAMAQHSEAASFCFACISQIQPKDAPLSSPSDFCSDDISYDQHRNSLSDLLFYSCTQWPEHCRIAFAGGSNRHMVVLTRDFILGDAYSTWNTLLSGICRRLWLLSPLDSVWHAPLQKKPGFVIVVFGLIRLLEDPAIRKMISLHDVNGIGRDLFYVSLAYSERTTVVRLLQLFPDLVPWDGDFRLLRLAVWESYPEAVERLLMSRKDEEVYEESIRHASFWAVRYTWTSSCVGSEAFRILKKLLFSGIKTWTKDDCKRLMNCACRKVVEDLLINWARDLEAKGLCVGSMQEMIAIRDGEDATFAEIGKPFAVGSVWEQRETLQRFDVAVLSPHVSLYGLGAWYRE